MIFKRCESVNTNSLYFKNMPINCVHECDLLGITLSSSRTTANVIEKAVMKFNMKSNEIITDFKLLPCYIKSKLFTTFCTDAYGCQLWNFESRKVHFFLDRLEKSSETYVITEIPVIHMYLLPLKLFSSLNMYLRYRNICNNMHLSLYIKCCIVLL